MIPRGAVLKGDQAVLAVENPRAAFAVLLQLFRPPEAVKKGISQYAFIHPSAKVGKNVAILPFAYVAEDAEIGDNTVIYPHVYVGRHVKVGCDCTLYSNVTVREDCIRLRHRRGRFRLHHCQWQAHQSAPDRERGPGG